MINIGLRAAEVAARIVPGHWQGDRIDGGLNRSSGRHIGSTGFGRGFAPIGGEGLPAGTSATGTVSSTPITCR